MNQKIRKEAIKRLEILRNQGLDDKIVRRYIDKGKVSFSVQIEGTMHIGDFDNFPKYKEILETVEREYDVHIYHGMLNTICSQAVIAFLAVDEYTDEWADDRRWLSEKTSPAYGYNMTGQFSEDGCISYKIVDGGMVRTA